MPNIKEKLSEFGEFFWNDFGGCDDDSEVKIPTDVQNIVTELEEKTSNMPKGNNKDYLKNKEKISNDNEKISNVREEMPEQTFQKDKNKNERNR